MIKWFKYPPLQYFFPEIDRTIFDYPRLWNNIPDTISEEEFLIMWEQHYGVEYAKCKVRFGDTTEEECFFLFRNVLIVKLPHSITFSTFFGHHITDSPLLSEEDTFFYEGYGPSFDYDLLGELYLKIDPMTNLPIEWEFTRRVFILNRYLEQIGIIKA